ncbi:tRNA-queuosine alpha-mannosyltransferase domain-containing protein [Desulforhopalus sp. 52FAK]
MKKILILEPYFGGSHKHFLEGLMKTVDAEYVILSLPARKWKMRMQLSAQWFVEQLEGFEPQKRQFDTVLCSTFIDVAVFRALVCRLPGWNTLAKICLYFHENQFAYPNRTDDKSLYHFTAINFNSALAADSIAFNSEFNRASFLKGCKRYLKFASDMKFTGLLDKMISSSVVIHPGIEFSLIDRNRRKDTSHQPVIVWNHRWEHDKNPDEFFEGLRHLKQKDIDFKLIVLGQSFHNSPDCFVRGKREFKEEILHYGFSDSYDNYVKLLSQGTVVVSTSVHEFYGISVIEAVRAGCRPLLPNRLSYPELFPAKYLYDQKTFPSQLEKIVRENRTIRSTTALELTRNFSWPALKSDYDRWLLAS